VCSGARRLRTVASCEFGGVGLGSRAWEVGEGDIGGGGLPAGYRRSERLIAEPGGLAGCRGGSALSPVYGADKTTGMMDPLQQATNAGDLHQWEMSLQ
jgi:hypothetical protein